MSLKMPCRYFSECTEDKRVLCISSEFSGYVQSSGGYIGVRSGDLPSLLTAIFVKWRIHGLE